MQPAPETTSTQLPETLWGVYDAKDKCWIGHDTGPFIFTDDMAKVHGKTISGESLARYAATVMNERMQTRFRFGAKAYTENADKMKDTITPVISFKDAVKNLEAKP